ncbi:helix-turn-helix domain-containing protein [Spirillospora albida]|uniref:helix-turn-helix domain-containing protein n=1 Tax=Spirillospora albida TaxID=58123 RepID=UPI0006892FDD|nr:helix-turn-helix transcriptional regulator [Spirillospora albida]
MTEAPRSTVRLRKIGRELRRLREESGYTLVTAGRHLERSASSLSKIETGAQWLRLRDLTHILDVYEAPPDLRAALTTLAEQDRQPGWWDAYRDLVSPEALDHASLEWSSTHKVNAETTFVPGLLQTEDYARALQQNRLPHSPLRKLDHFVDFRLARQQVLSREDPVHLDVLLDEAALRRIRGGRQVMRSQLRRLLLESEQNHVHLQVLPFAADPGNAYPGQFEIMDIGTPPILSVALTDHITRRTTHEDHDVISKCRSLYSEARTIALPEPDSRDLVHGILSGL